MEKLSIVATFVVRPEHVECAMSEMLKLIEPTRGEMGCLKYELYRDNENSNTFIFEEVWASGEDLKNHANSEHFQSFMAVTEGMMESFNVNKLTQLA